MKAIVEEALQKAQNDLDHRLQEERKSLAVHFNLYDREYAPDGMYSEAFPFYSKKDQPPRNFRKVAIMLSDEEFDALREMKVRLEKSPSSHNNAMVEGKTTNGGTTGISVIYNVIGVLILVVFFIIAVTQMSSSSYIYREYGTLVAIVIMAIGFFSSLSFFAIAKGLLLLQEIANNTLNKP